MAPLINFLLFVILVLAALIFVLFLSYCRLQARLSDLEDERRFGGSRAGGSCARLLAFLMTAALLALLFLYVIFA